MTALHHKKGIRCIHIHGWLVQKWCPQCRARWNESAAEGFTERDYERESDVALAHAALVAMEGGEIPISPLLADFDLGQTFEQRMPLPKPHAN